MKTDRAKTISRRNFLKTATATSLAAVALPGRNFGGEEIKLAPPKGKAEHCVFIWLGGGACHVDMWDPKRLGDSKKVAGSAYPAIETAIPGVQVCEHLSNCAKVLDRFILLRTLH